MSFEQALNLVARAGLLSQLAFALVVGVLFLILRPYAGPTRRYFGYWQWAWLAMAAAIGALTLRFHRYPDATQARFGSESAAAALHAVYQFGKLAFFALLLAGTLYYVRGAVSARTRLLLGGGRTVAYRGVRRFLPRSAPHGCAVGAVFPLLPA
jgi:hypothetical protein